jgi:uncharacterized membrane protein YiaA
MSEPRQQGSTITARILGVVLVCVGVLLPAITNLKPGFDWISYRAWVNYGSCILFGGMLLWWGFCKSLTKPVDHYQETKSRIGFETITMVVGVLTALIAIWTLTDAASKHCH